MHTDGAPPSPGAAAWATAALGLVALVVTNGLTGPGLSAFDNALIDEFGWDRATLKLRDTVTYATAAVFLPAAGWAIDRFGVRWTMVAGSVLLAVGMFLYGSIAAAWQMYAIHGLFSMSLALAGVGTVVIFVSSWFAPKARGAALGLAIAGTSVGGIVFSQLNARLLETVGWRSAFEIEAGIAAAFVVLAAVAVRRGPYKKAEGKPGATDAPSDASLTFGQAVRTVPFWAICGSGLITYFSIVGTLANLVLLAGDLGLTTADGVNAISLLLLVSLGSKLGSGVVADRIGPYRLFRACFGVMAVGLGRAGGVAAVVAAPGGRRGRARVGRPVHPLQLRPDRDLRAGLGGQDHEHDLDLQDDRRRARPARLRVALGRDRQLRGAVLDDDGVSGDEPGAELFDPPAGGDGGVTRRPARNRSACGTL